MKFLTLILLTLSFASQSFASSEHARLSQIGAATILEVKTNGIFPVETLELTYARPCGSKYVGILETSEMKLGVKSIGVIVTHDVACMGPSTIEKVAINLHDVAIMERQFLNARQDIEIEMLDGLNGRFEEARLIPAETVDFRLERKDIEITVFPPVRSRLEKLTLTYMQPCGIGAAGLFKHFNEDEKTLATGVLLKYSSKNPILCQALPRKVETSTYVPSDYLLKVLGIAFIM